VPILDIECICGSRELVIDYTKEPGMKHILCKKCGLRWTDPDMFDPDDKTLPEIIESDSSDNIHTATVEE
jgi:hypothetical protein